MTSPSNLEGVFVGVDPGFDGGLVAIDSRARVRLAASWKRVQRRGKKVPELRVASSAQAGAIHRVLCPRFPMLAVTIVDEMTRAGLVPKALAVEDAYLGRNPKTTVIIARTTGLIVGPLEGLWRLDSAWVKATEWRATILGLPRNTKRAQAKHASMTFMPSRCPGLSRMLDLLGHHDHLTDAAGIADWSRLSNQ